MAIDADDIAAEQIAWWQGAGFGPDEAAAALTGSCWPHGTTWQHVRRRLLEWLGG